MAGLSIEEKILAAFFLCSAEKNQLLDALKPAWSEKVSLPLKEKVAILCDDFEAKNIFLWQDEISEAIDSSAFIISHLQQPDLFVRIRPGNEKIVKEKLQKAGITHVFIGDYCIALPNASKIETVLNVNKEVVIQDYNSQRVGRMMEIVKKGSPEKKVLNIWDCCAASGGKSIMAKDIFDKMDLSVSDIREPILHNLNKRVSEAGIKEYKSFIADLSKPVERLDPAIFDLIIADVPCTGSGTWGRTPEHLSYFRKEKIDFYQRLQRQIVSNAVPHIKAGSYFLYITCSVFKKENEENAEFIRNDLHLELISKELLEGYFLKADTLFTALFKKPL